MNISLLLLAGCLVLLQSSSYAQVKKSKLMQPRQRCMMYCPFGNDPNKACGCLSGPGRRDLCSSKICGKGERCVQRRGIARCMPNSQIYPIPGPFPGRRGVCKQPKVVGRCRAALRRYYYNPSSGSCKQFIYGGCGGNQNNFQSLSESCRQEKVVGRCKIAIQRYFFNQKTRMCEPFMYGGCGGNDNNFKSLAECQKRCPGGLFNLGQGGGRGNFGRGGARGDFGRGRGNGQRGGGQGNFGRGLGRGDFGSGGFGRVGPGRGDGQRGGGRGGGRRDGSWVRQQLNRNNDD